MKMTRRPELVACVSWFSSNLNHGGDTFLRKVGSVLQTYSLMLLQLKNDAGYYANVRERRRGLNCNSTGPTALQITNINCHFLHENKSM
jgi:hypothetical protein